MTYSPYFDNGSADPNYFIPSSKVNYLGLEKLESFQIPEFFCSIPVLAGFLYIKEDIFSIIFISCLYFVFIVRTLKRNISVYQMGTFKLYVPFIIQFALSFFFFKVLHKDYNLNNDELRNISSIVTAIISADLIFNFTAMFILQQENFNKYNSLYLLKKTVTSWTIFIEK